MSLVPDRWSLKKILKNITATSTKTTTTISEVVNLPTSTEPEEVAKKKSVWRYSPLTSLKNEFEENYFEF